MAKRMLHSNITTSDKIGLISDFEEVLYNRLMLLTDSWGCVKYAEGYIKDECFPVKKNNTDHRNNKVNYNAIQKAINNLIKTGLLVPLEYDGIEYLIYRNFYQFQELKSDRLGKSILTGKGMEREWNPLDLLPEQDWNGTGTEPPHEVEDKVEVKDKYICLENFPSVKLTKEEYEKLSERFNGSLNERIENLYLYIKSKGDKYKSHYATILMWAKKEEKEGKPISSYKEKFNPMELIL